jgi:hypothetical protein
MGLFWDAVNAVKKAVGGFRKDTKAILAEIRAVTPQYERHERQYDPRLAYSKGKSQRRNWSKWRRRR